MPAKILLDTQKVIEAYEDNWSLRKTAKLFGCSFRPISNILRANNIEITHEIKLTPEYRKKRSEVMKRQHAQKMFCGGGHSQWKGGRTGNGHGYILLYKPGHPRASESHYVPEHTIVAESVLGRFLKEGEIIHHINEKMDDNNPSNLYLFSSNGEHMRYHFHSKSGKTQPIMKTNLYELAINR